MPSLEERVAYLEGQNGEHAGAFDGVRDDLRDVRNEVRDVREEMIRRFERADRRFEQMDTRFTWVVGLQFATLLAVISSLLNLR